MVGARVTAEQDPCAPPRRSWWRRLTALVTRRRRKDSAPDCSCSATYHRFGVHGPLYVDDPSGD